jgi:signal peptidase II
VAVIILALDQATKFLVVQYIPLHESWSLFPALAKIFKFTYITNTGAAFGMFPQLGGVFMVVAIMVIAAIVIFYQHLPTGNFWVRTSLGLQLGGALGNLLDRITRGYVVDFVDIGFWPIFNLADLSIVFGVTILAYFLWNEENSLDRLDHLANLSKGGNPRTPYLTAAHFNELF